jgi:hypothetical protein
MNSPDDDDDNDDDDRLRSKHAGTEKKKVTAKLSP